MCLCVCALVFARVRAFMPEFEYLDDKPYDGPVPIPVWTFWSGRIAWKYMYNYVTDQKLQHRRPSIGDYECEVRH